MLPQPCQPLLLRYVQPDQRSLLLVQGPAVLTDVDPVVVGDVHGTMSMSRSLAGEHLAMC
jgi:hypothetical protein